ncbi:MAG: tetratricopeptide repeat protein [Candidatus Sumerlaeaceae bacterium]
MKNEASQPQRRGPQQTGRRRPSSAAAILKTKGTAGPLGENYFSPRWVLLGLTLLTISLVAFLFTPYTHQLDEIKNVILMFFPPFLLIGALFLKDFRTMSWRTHGSTILLGLFFLNMIISFLINDFKLIGERVIWFWTGCATFTVVFAWFMDSELKMRRVMLYWTLLGLASTIIGLFMFAGQGFTAIIYDFMKNDRFWAESPWTTLFYTLKSSRGDMYSFVLNQDFYAAFLVMTLPIPLAMFFAEQKMIYRAVALASFLLMNVCLVLTNSNDSYPSIIVAYVLFIILAVKYVQGWNFSRRFIVVFLICIGVLLAEVALLMLPTVASTWAFKSAAFEGRKVLWGGGFWPWLYGYDRTHTNLDFSAILFGVGPGGYRHFFPWFRRPDFFDQQINNVTTFGHNWYLDVLLETGAVGLILFMWFHFRVIKDALRQIRTTQSRTHLLYQVAIVCGLAGIAIQNFSSPNNRWAVAGMTYWAMFGLCMGLHHLEHPGVSKKSDPGTLPIYNSVRIGAIVFALVFLWRCSLNHAFNYWSAAKKNATGLKFMETAQAPGLPDDQRPVYLQIAQKQFEEAISENPTFATSYYKLGNVYNSVEATDKAIKTYEELNKISPSYSEIYLNLGIMYYVEATEKAQRIGRLRKTADQKLAEASKARSEERQKLRDEAGQLTEEAASIEAQLPELMLHNYEKSYDAFKEAARQSLKPNVQMLAADQGQQLAELYEDAGAPEKAAGILEEIKKHYWTVLTYEPKLEDVKADRKRKYPVAQAKLYELSQKTHDMAGAEKVLKLMVADNPDNQQYLLRLLRAYDQQGKTKEKIEYLEIAVHDNPVDSRLRAILADAYAQAGDQAKYMAELQRVEVLQPGSPTALSGLYLAYKEKDKSKAEHYRGKLQQIGVSADDLTTIIREGVSTATLAASKPKQDQAAPAEVATSPSVAGQPVTPAEKAITGASTQTVATAITQGAATSATAASAAVTAPTPVTLPPAPGTQSSDAPTTAPGPETSTSASK